MPIPLVFGHHESVAQVSANRENDRLCMHPIRARRAGAELVGPGSAAVNAFPHCGAACARHIESAEAMA
jgi:hypothetical protein